jgi:hypothetical protein
MSPLLLYLDQCAACDLALPTPPWNKIRNLIETKVEEGKLLCPLSFETVLESTACDKATRVALAVLFEQISSGWKIHFFDDLIGQETIHLVRKQPMKLLDRYANLIPIDDAHSARDGLERFL